MAMLSSSDWDTVKKQRFGSDDDYHGYLSNLDDNQASSSEADTSSSDSSDSGSTADAVANVMAGLGQDLHDILTLVGGVQQDQSQMQMDYAKGETQAVEDAGNAIANHYNNTTYHEILNSASDENGNITPESAAEAENGDNSGADPLQSEEDQIISHIGDDSYNVDNQTQNTFQTNLRNDINDWGSNLYNDTKALAGTVYDELTATSLQQLQQLDYQAGQNLWDVYSDIARPAGMIAMTPEVPAPIRGVAGILYAPKFLSDIGDMYNGTGEGGGEGGISGVVQGLVVNPLNQMIEDISNPEQLVEDIKAHPANLWDRVLMPATMAEGGYHAVRKGADLAGTAKDKIASAFSKDDSAADTAGGDEFTPPPVESAEDIVQEADDAAGPSTGYSGGDGVAHIDTGHGDIDLWINDAAAQNGVDPVILHKMAQQESGHGEADSNVMQVLDSTGAAMGFDDMSDPKQSIYAGAKYLAEMLKQDGGDYDAAIRDYNGGGDPNYLQHVMDQPDYGTPEYQGGGSSGGYDVPAEAEYTLEPGAIHDGFDEGTEAKLRLLDKWYADHTGGEHLDISSMRDGTHSDPNHAAGRAADIVNDRLQDPEFRAQFTEAAHELGFKTYDEFDKSNWTENTTGYNFHISDDGTPLSNLRYRSNGPTDDDPYGLNKDDNTSTSAPEPDDDGPLKDLNGKEIDEEEEGTPKEGKADSAEEEAQQEAEDLQKATEPAKVNWGEGDTANDARELDNYIDSLEQERQRMIDEEVQLMKDNPGGKGVDVGYTTDDRGQINGRWAQSNNQQWYQDAYKTLGRKPRNADLPYLAEDRLHNVEEFDTVDRELTKARMVRDYMREHPTENVDDAFDYLDQNGLLQGDKNGQRNTARIDRSSRPTNNNLAHDNNPMLQAESNAPEPMKTTQAGQPVPDREGRQPVSTLGTEKPKGNYLSDTVTRENIFKRARELFGTIRNGRTGSGFNGWYNRGTDVARTSEYGQWDTMWHEIGHKVDQYLGISNKAGDAYNQEFMHVLDRKYPDGFLHHYRLDEVPSEGAAEFMKEYMMDRDKAKADFPKYYDFWTKEVGKDKDLAARVEEMRQMMDTYQKQPLGAKIRSTIRHDEKPTVSEKVKKAVDDFWVNWIDDKYGIKTAENEVERIIGRKLAPEESAYIYARIAKDRGASAAMQILTGTDAEAVTKALNKIYGGVLKKAVTFPMVLEKLKELDKKGKDFLKKNGLKDSQEALSTYLIARRFMEVHDLKAKGNHEYKMPRSYDEYKDFVDSAPKELKEAAQDIYDINRNILAIMHHEGMLTDKAYAALISQHKHYVSLARAFDDDANKGGGLGFNTSENFINVSNNINKLSDEGSVRDVKDPLQTIPANIARSLIAVEHNKVAQKFVAHSELYGTGGVIEKVSGTAKTTDSTFCVYQHGKQEVYATTPEIYQAFQSLKPDGMDNLTYLLLKMPSNIMRAGAVVYNPAFLAKNLGRDQLTAFLYSKYGYKPFYDMAKGMFHLLKKDDLYHEYVTSGALMSAITQDTKTMVPELAKQYANKSLRGKIFKAINPMTSLPALSEFIEQSTRMGLYSRARRHGASITAATMEARESTLDFGRAGIKGRKWNRYVPFFNAVIQDPVIFMERVRENPVRMLRRSAPMIMGSLALYALIQSNSQWADEYDEMMPYEKNMFWNIPVPKWVSETGWVRYPKPFGPGFLFASLPERLADVVKGKDKSGKGMKEWAKGFLEGFNPVALPPLIQAVYEWQANYSFFRERSVVPQREQKLPDEQQYGPTTSEVAKFLGSKLGLSPRKIDNLGQNLMAGAWQQGNALIDTLHGDKGRNLNPLKSLTVDPNRAPQSIQDFYEHMQKADADYAGEKNTKGKASANATYNHHLMLSAQKQMSELNKQERAAVQKGDQKAIDEINKKQLKLARDALKMYREK